MKHILVTGSNGALGSSVKKIFSKSDWQLLLPSHVKLDVSNFSKVTEYFRKASPNIVLHMAAITNVDYCEAHASETYKVNTDATKHLVKECRKFNIPFYFISTGAVFSGTKQSPYTEVDKLKPINIYGKSKLRAEREIIKYKNHCIIRTGWLIGGSKRDKKFISFILKQIKQKKKEIKVVTHIYGSPTLTDDLAKVIMKLIKKNARGTFHVVNKGVASRIDITKEVLKILNIKNIKIIPVKLGYFHEKAKRPKMEALKSIRLKRIGITELPSWQYSLKKYLLSLS